MKDTTLTNTRCLIKACERLGVSYQIHDHHDNFVEVIFSQPYFFTNTTTPFNVGSIGKICKDKEFAYRLLEGVVPMPYSKGYFNPLVSPASRKYVLVPTLEAVTEDILKNFSLPVIVKRNAGSLGSNVFLCRDRREIEVALQTIYTKDSHYDYVALAQEYIKASLEYRAVVFAGELIFAYAKDISEASFNGNLSPLHYDNAKAILVTDKALLTELKNFIFPLLKRFPVEYTGLDIVRDQQGKLQLIELNGHPGFSRFVKDNGDEELIRLYERMLTALRARTT